MPDYILEIIKFTGAFITFFFMWKKYSIKIKSVFKEAFDAEDILDINLTKILTCKEFMITVITSLAWFYVLPLYLAWMLLEKIYNKIINKN